MGRAEKTSDKRKAQRATMRTALFNRDAPIGLTVPWLPNPPAKKGTDAYLAWAQEAFIELIREGWNYTKAAEFLGYRGYQWVYQLRTKDPVWWAEVQAARSGHLGQWELPDLSGMSFEDFVGDYFGIEFAEHQKRIAGALEDPLANMILVLGHPESGKSTQVSLWYPTYALAVNPDVRIALVSKATDKANDLLTRVKRYLTEEHLYADAPRNLIADFNGFKPAHGDLSWSASQIFIRHRKSGERDPTIQALGIGKQIYGTRIDKLILDDSLVLDNQVSEVQRERLDRWFTSEARSRALQGQTVVNGTRLFPLDLYGVWRKRWAEHPLYREVIIPAILDEYTDSERPSWPEHWDLDGYNLTEAIGGEEIVVGYKQGLRDIRKEFLDNVDQWKLVYQQQDVELGGSVFNQAHADKAIELGKDRELGQYFEHERLILAVDPATSARAAVLVIAVDPASKIRTVIDGWTGSKLGTTGMRQQLFYSWWEKYKEQGIALTVIEQNFSPTLMGDEALMAKAREYNTVIQPFWTKGRGRGIGSKWHEEYGVGGIAGQISAGLVAFASASPEAIAVMQPIIDDMLIFPYQEPTGDSLMALWFGLSESGNVFLDRINEDEVILRRNIPPYLQRGQGRRL